MGRIPRMNIMMNSTGRQRVWKFGIERKKFPIFCLRYFFLVWEGVFIKKFCNFACFQDVFFFHISHGTFFMVREKTSFVRREGMRILKHRRWWWGLVQCFWPPLQNMTHKTRRINTASIIAIGTTMIVGSIIF